MATNITYLQAMQQVNRENALKLMSDAASLEEFASHLVGYFKGYKADLVNDDTPFSVSFNLKDAELSVHISVVEKLGFWECYIDKNGRGVAFLSLDLTSDESLMELEVAIRRQG